MAAQPEAESDPLELERFNWRRRLWAWPRERVIERPQVALWAQLEPPPQLSRRHSSSQPGGQAASKRQLAGQLAQLGCPNNRLGR